jgi:hypothetical protein
MAASSSADDEMLSVHNGSFLARGRCFDLDCRFRGTYSGEARVPNGAALSLTRPVQRRFTQVLAPGFDPA